MTDPRRQVMHPGVLLALVLFAVFVIPAALTLVLVVIS